MNGAKLNKEELTQLIFYAIKENNIEVKNINANIIKSIINDYQMYCNHFQMAYVIGELDTFKRASCLLVAINKNKIVSDKRTNASIALDAAYKMCETPYWYVGKNNDEPKKLEEIEFKKVFETNIEIFKHSKEMLVDSLVYEDGLPLNYHLNLELLYQVALEMKSQKEKQEGKNNKPKSLAKRFFSKK